MCFSACNIQLLVLYCVQAGPAQLMWMSCLQGTEASQQLDGTDSRVAAGPDQIILLPERMKPNWAAVVRLLSAKARSLPEALAHIKACGHSGCVCRKAGAPKLKGLWRTVRELRCLLDSVPCSPKGVSSAEAFRRLATSGLTTHLLSPCYGGASLRWRPAPSRRSKK